MTSWQRRAFTALTAVVTATGLLYFWMKDVLTTDDPFAVINHPLQPAMLDLHVLAAPALLVVFGIVFNAHIGRKLSRPGPMRRSGLSALVAFAVMAGSGYLLPVAVDGRVHSTLVWTHLGSGLVFAGSYSVHLVGGLRLWRGSVLRVRPAAR